MQGKLAAITAAASGLILMSAVAASAAPSVNFKGSLGSSSLVELAREGGGGGGGRGGGGGWGGGGGMKSGGGSGLKSGGGGMKSGGGGGRAYSGRSYGGGDGWKGRSGGNNFKGRSSGRYAGKGWDGGDFKRGGSSKRWDGDKRRHASRDRDGRKFQRHRVWRNGAWVWVYGPDIYAYGDDCGWLWQRAQATGSPYWWSRYEACVGYY